MKIKRLLTMVLVIAMIATLFTAVFTPTVSAALGATDIGQWDGRVTWHVAGNSYSEWGDSEVYVNPTYITANNPTIDDLYIELLFVGSSVEMKTFHWNLFANRPALAFVPLDVYVDGVYIKTVQQAETDIGSWLGSTVLFDYTDGISDDVHTLRLVPPVPDTPYPAANRWGGDAATGGLIRIDGFKVWHDPDAGKDPGGDNETLIATYSFVGIPLTVGGPQPVWTEFGQSIDTLWGGYGPAETITGEIVAGDKGQPVLCLTNTAENQCELWADHTPTVTAGKTYRWEMRAKFESTAGWMICATLPNVDGPDFPSGAGGWGKFYTAPANADWAIYSFTGVASANGSGAWCSPIYYVTKDGKMYLDYIKVYEVDDENDVDLPVTLYVQSHVGGDFDYSFYNGNGNVTAPAGDDGVITYNPSLDTEEMGIEITAYPYLGYVFEQVSWVDYGWNGGTYVANGVISPSGLNTAVVPLYDMTTFAAAYAENGVYIRPTFTNVGTWDVDVTVAGDGAVKRGATDVSNTVFAATKGATETLTFEAGDGYELTSLLVDGTESISYVSGNSYELTVSKDTPVVATFTATGGTPVTIVIDTANCNPDGSDYIVYGILGGPWVKFGFEITNITDDPNGLPNESYTSAGNGDLKDNFAGFTDGKFGLTLSGEGIDGIDFWLHMFACGKDGVYVHPFPAAWEFMAWD